MKISLGFIGLYFLVLTSVLADPPPFPTMPCPSAGHQAFVYEIEIGKDKIRMPFAIFLPKDYEVDKNRKWPMIVFLHGGGEAGTDLVGVFVNGISAEASRNPPMLKNFPFIICLPQSYIQHLPNMPQDVYTGWDDMMSKAMVSLAKKLPDYYRIDRDRISLTGLSMGGNGTWTGLDTDSELWAAAVPISGRAWKDPTGLATRLRYCPIWTIGGLADAPHFVEGARKMHRALINAGVDSQLTLIPNVGHFAWMLHYNNPEFFQWLLRQTRPAPESRAQAEAFRKLENEDNSLCAKDKMDALAPGRPDNKDLVAGFDGQWFKDDKLKTRLVRRIEQKVDYTDGYKLPGDVRENVSLRLSGWVKIDKPGVYNFITAADDGSRLTIGGQRIIDDWLPHGLVEQVGSVRLKPGLHKICVEYFQGGGLGAISVFWSGPDIPRRLLGESDVQCEPMTINVAAEENGGVATASSTHASSGFHAKAAINGDRLGISWSSDPVVGSGWHSVDTTLPSWLQIDFKGEQPITEVDIFSVQDGYQAPVDPTPTMVFTLYGLIAFQVQYWTGSAWEDVPGGKIIDNNLVWRKITFPAINSSKIRVQVNATKDLYSRIIEVEAWRPLTTKEMKP